MKPIWLVTSLLLTLLATASFADEKHAPAEYNYLIKYEGIYQPYRLYKLHPVDQMWFGSRSIKYLKDIQCFEATNALHTGTWTGNLSDQGECLGYAEAPTWAIGNYLNYQLQKRRQEKEEKD